ncbi:MAG: lycopene cyclase domain-containing protein [Caldilineales bacterium]|nr:lycopene cyclase domain-containing protein [Caldilineales bacterium]
MTYFGFLAIFLGIPLLFMAALTWRDMRQGRSLPVYLQGISPWMTLFILIVVAVLYTTPWDNYLVATGVWFYDPALVTGITIGWVPIEEYTFFVLQTLLTGLMLLWAARRLPSDLPVIQSGLLRWASNIPLIILWLLSVLTLVFDWQPGIYLALILVWALPPIIFQLAFGADILWRQRRLVFSVLALVTLYLAAADSLAISSGTWTIDPAQSLQIHLGGILPVEEFIFFLVTNTLVVFGMTLILSTESRTRVPSFRRRSKEELAS